MCSAERVSSYPLSFDLFSIHRFFYLLIWAAILALRRSDANNLALLLGLQFGALSRLVSQLLSALLLTLYLLP